MRGQRERTPGAGRRRRAHTPVRLRLPPGPGPWPRLAEVAAPDGGRPVRARTRTAADLEVLPVRVSRPSIPVVFRRAAAAGLVAVCASFASGCFFFHRAKPEPPTLVINQPIVLSTEPVLNVPTPAPPVVTPPPAPAPAKTATKVERPHHASRARADHEEKEAAAAPPPLVNTADMPQLTPQLSPAESEARRRATTEWLDAAQHDLELVAARSLSSAQQANRSQADEYIRQARQALGQGDVVRAQNLAHKALVIAEAILDSAG